MVGVNLVILSPAKKYEIAYRRMWGKMVKNTFSFLEVAAKKGSTLKKKIGAQKRTEKKGMGMWTWRDVGFEDREKLIVGEGLSTHTVTLYDLRGTACLI